MHFPRPKILSRLRWPLAPAPAQAEAKSVHYTDGQGGSIGWRDFFGSLTGNWSSADGEFFYMSDAQQEDTFDTNAVVRGCVQTLASTTVKARLELGQYIKGEWAAVKNHWTLDLLAYVNDYYSTEDLYQNLVARTVLTGMGYAVKIRNKSGSRVVQLVPLPTSWITPIKGHGLQPFSGFRISGTGEPIPAQDMLYMKELSPASASGSRGRLNSAGRQLLIDQEISLYQTEMFLNLKMPTFTFHTEFALSEPEKEDIRKTFRQKHGRGHRGQDPFFHSGKDGKIDFLNPLLDLDYKSLTNLTETRICTAFGVPPMLIGTQAGLERSTYSNYIHQRRSFYQETMADIWEFLASALTLGLLRAEGEQRLKFRFMYEELPEFQEDRDKKAERVRGLYKDGVFTLDEARIEVGREAVGPAKGGDDFFKPAAGLTGFEAA